MTEFFSENKIQVLLLGEHWYDSIVVACGVLLRIVWWAHPAYNLDVDLLWAAIQEKNILQLATEGLSYCQSAPLGFLVLAKLWGAVSWSGDRWLALPMLGASIATLFLWRKVLRLADVERPVYLLGLFLFAFHPALIAYASFLKPYGLDALFATAFLYFVLKRPVSRHDLARVSFLVFFAPFFSTGSFFVIAPMLFLILRHLLTNTTGTWRYRLQHGLAKFSLIAIAAMLGYGLNLLHLLRTMPQGMYAYWADDFAPLPSNIQAATWYWLRLVRMFRGPIYFTWQSYFLSPFQLVLFVIPFVILIAGAQSTKHSGRIAGWVFLGSVFPVYLASAIDKWPIRAGTVAEGRLLMFLIPSATLCLIKGTNRLFGRHPVSLLFFSSFVVASVLQPLGIRDKIRNTWSPVGIQSFVASAPLDSELHLDDVAHAFFRAHDKNIALKSIVHHDETLNQTDTTASPDHDVRPPAVFVFGRPHFHTEEIEAIRTWHEQGLFELRERTFSPFLVQICN